MVYNIAANSWEDPEISHDIPRWNLSGVIVPAIPSWKFFMFGGSTGNFPEDEKRNRTLSKMSNDCFVLDMKSLKWQTLELEDEKQEKPRTRENSAMIYDT
jgi:dynein heavy chain